MTGVPHVFATQPAGNVPASYLDDNFNATYNYTPSGTGAVQTTVSAKLHESVSVLDFGADNSDAAQNVTDIQNAATAVGNTGYGQNVLSVPSGHYLLTASPATSAILLLSDTNVNGTGGEFDSVMQNHYFLAAVNASNVSINNLKCTAQSTSGENDAMAAFIITATSGSFENFSFINNWLYGTSWGIIVSAETGTGALAGIRFIGNNVDSNSTNRNCDGLHSAGNVTNTVMVGNTIRNRGDAALAISGGTGGGYPTNGFAIVGNSTTDCEIGADCSGASYGVVVGNSLRNTYDSPASNPCLRIITNVSALSQDVLAVGNYAVGVHTSSGEVDVKVTSAGQPSHAGIIANMFKTFYTDATYVTISDNVIKSGGSIICSNNSGNIQIGRNHFEGAFDIVGQGNKGLAGPVNVASQSWDKTNASNFLPNFWTQESTFTGTVTGNTTLTITSVTGTLDIGHQVYAEGVYIGTVTGGFGTSWTITATSNISSVGMTSQRAINPYWAGIWTFECSYRQLNIVPFSSTAATPTDIIGANFSVNYPSVLADIELNYTLNSSAAQLFITDMNNNIWAGVYIISTQAYFNFPTNPSGSAYLTKLPAGMYKIRYSSPISNLTLNSISIGIWN